MPRLQASNARVFTERQPQPSSIYASRRHQSNRTATHCRAQHRGQGDNSPGSGTWEPFSSCEARSNTGQAAANRQTFDPIPSSGTTVRDQAREMQKCQSPSPNVGAMTEYNPDKAWKKQTSRHTTHVTACLLAWSPLRPSTPEASAVSLGSTAALIATGRSESVPRRA